MKQFFAVFSKAAFAGEGRLHKEIVGPFVVKKKEVPWFEGWSVFGGWEEDPRGLGTLK